MRQWWRVGFGYDDRWRGWSIDYVLLFRVLKHLCFLLGEPRGSAASIMSYPLECRLWCLTAGPKSVYMISTIWWKWDLELRILWIVIHCKSNPYSEKLTRIPHLQSWHCGIENVWGKKWGEKNSYGGMERGYLSSGWHSLYGNIIGWRWSSDNGKQRTFAFHGMMPTWPFHSLYSTDIGYTALADNPSL